MSVQMHENIHMVTDTMFKSAAAQREAGIGDWAGMITGGGGGGGGGGGVCPT